MAGRHNTITIEIDGRRLNGFWTLRQGNKLCVSWGEAIRVVELKPGERPEARAEKVLRQIVDKARRDREAWERRRAKPHREA